MGWKLSNPFKRKPSRAAPIATPEFYTGASVKGSVRGSVTSNKPADDHPVWLLLAGIAVIALPKLPFGLYLAYPFMILTTWFHEMGHGLTALALGQGFEELVIFENGSGYAVTLSSNDTWNITHALMSAGGPLGPAIAGSLMILASQTAKMRRLALSALAFIMILSLAVWVRSIIGWAVILPMSLLILLVANKGSEGLSRFVTQFLGIQAAVSMFGQWDYLFSSGAFVGGSHQVSDTGAIAQELLLPYWIWAGILIAAGAAMIGASLYRVLVTNRRKNR